MLRSCIVLTCLHLYVYVIQVFNISAFMKCWSIFEGLIAKRANQCILGQILDTPNLNKKGTNSLIFMGWFHHKCFSSTSVSKFGLTMHTVGSHQPLIYFLPVGWKWRLFCHIWGGKILRNLTLTPNNKYECVFDT